MCPGTSVISLSEPLKKYLKISCRHQKDHLRVGHQFQWPSPHHGDATAKELPTHCRAHTVTPAAAIGEHFDAHMFFNLSYYLEAHTSSVWLQWHQNCFLVVFKRGYSYFNIMFLPSTFILMNLIDKYYLNQLLNISKQWFSNFIKGLFLIIFI